MNNLAYACGMRAVFKFSYFVGTFGEYDPGVITTSFEASVTPSRQPIWSQ